MQHRAPVGADGPVKVQAVGPAVFGEPAGVTGAAALKKACEQGLIEKDATVVSVVTGNGLKDVANAIKSAGEPLHIEPDLGCLL